MARDVRDKLVIDPILQDKKVEVVGVRLLQGDRLDSDGEFRYELAVALRRAGKKWPKGEFRIQVYDSSGILLENTFVSLIKSLDPERRHLEGSFYSEEFESAELVFEPAREQDLDEWDELVVTRDTKSEEILSVEAVSVRAQTHPDFTYPNLTLIEVKGEVRPVSGLPFPSGLVAQVTVYDESGHMLNSDQLDLRFGPDSARSMRITIQVYNHEEPASVRLEFFKS